MSTATDGKLLARLTTLTSGAESRKTDRISQRKAEMVEVSRFQEVFDSVLDVLRGTVMEPKIAALSAVFPEGSVATKADAYGITVSIRPTGRFNVPATLSIQVHPDLGERRGRATFAVAVLPILSDYDRGGSTEFELAADGRATFSAFLDERIERFMCDYLAMHEPESPYQKDAVVVDPVCGMSFARAEAVASIEQAGRTFHFCCDACRDRFAAEPERYTAKRGAAP